MQFVYHDPDATTVTFVADILLRDWEDRSNTTVYQPDQYRPGLMRGGGAYETAMTDVGDGYWVTEVPLAAGANQYWFYVDGNRQLWVTDPANPPIYAPDGLTGTARRAFNKVNVPYDAQKQDYAPMAAREIENPRPDSPEANWSYVPFEVDGTTRTLGVYLPPNYDENRSTPYKSNYNVSSHPTQRAFAGLSMGSFVTSNIVNYDPTMFGYYGPWSGGVSINPDTPNLAVPYILYGGGAWDFGLPNPDAVDVRDAVGIVENVVVAGAHDFNAWNQLFTIFARDYLWKPGAFLSDEIGQLRDGVADTSLNKGLKNALTVKLDQAYKQVERGNTGGALGALDAFVDQVQALTNPGKLSAEEAAELTMTAEKVVFNVGYWNQ